MTDNSRFSASDLALILKTDKRNINVRAKSESWLFREESCRGGTKKIFNLGDLPIDIRQQIYSINSASNIGKKAGQLILSAHQITNNTIDSQNQCTSVNAIEDQDALDRFEILELLQQFSIKSGLSKTDALSHFINEYNSRLLVLDCQNRITKLSRASLLRWRQCYKDKGLNGLISNKAARRSGKSVIESTPGLKDFLLAALNEFPQGKPFQFKKAMDVMFPGASEISISVRTIERFFSKWKAENEPLFTSMSAPSKWQNKYMTAFGSLSEEVTRVNQVWEFDSTPADVILTDGRFSIIGIIDVFTRRAKCVLCPTSNGEGIALLLRDAVLDWGVPEVARTDNGADYTSVRIKSVFKDLGVSQVPTAPYSGWEKPFIERFFRSFAHDVAELLPGFAGHNVAEREKLRGQLTFEKQLMKRRQEGEEKAGLNVSLSSKDFEDFLNKWIDGTYHFAEHSELKCTPMEMVAKHRHSVKTISTPHKLDILLAPVPGKNNGRRRVQKSGISVENVWYIAEELGPIVGEYVICRWNPKNAGEMYVFSFEMGEYICKAINPDIADLGITREEIAQAAKKLQQASVSKAKKALKKAAKPYKFHDVAQRIVEANYEKNKGVTNLPGPSIEVDNDITSAIEAAIEAESKPAQSTYSEEQLSEFERKRQQIEAKKLKNDAPTFSSAFGKAKYLTELTKSTTLPPVEKAWLYDYRRQHPKQAEFLDTHILKVNQGD